MLRRFLNTTTIDEIKIRFRHTHIRTEIIKGNVDFIYKSLQEVILSGNIEFLNAIMSKYTHAHEARQGKHKVQTNRT